MRTSTDTSNPGQPYLKRARNRMDELVDDPNIGAIPTTSMFGPSDGAFESCSTTTVLSFFVTLDYLVSLDICFVGSGFRANHCRSRRRL